MLQSYPLLPKALAINSLWTSAQSSSRWGGSHGFLLCPFRTPCHPVTAWAAQLCPMMDSASSSFCKYPHRSGTPLACSFHPSLFLMRLLVAALFHLCGNAQETNITSCMRTGRACRGTTVGMAFCRTALVAPFYGFFFPGNVYQLNQKHNLDFILATAPSSPSKILQCRAKANLIVQGLTSWKSRNS